MPLPENRLQAVMDYDFTALSVLLNEPPGVNYNIGLVTLTRAPAGLENVDPSMMPWLLQTDGPGNSDFQPSSVVNDENDLIYMGYVRPDARRFPDMSAPEIRRGVMADIERILDLAQHRVTDGQALVFDRTRTREAFDDPYGEWSMFIITERVAFNRYIGS